MKYTALDILTLAGVETPGDKIGKTRVTIGGVTVNDPTKVINTQDAESIECVVGTDKYTAQLPKELTAEQKTRLEEALKAKVKPVETPEASEPAQ